MKRNEAIELLEKYNDLIIKEGYADCDVWAEPPTAIDRFLNTEWAKENLPLKDNTPTVVSPDNYDSPIQYFMDTDPEFKSKIEAIAQKISDKYTEKR